MQALAVGLDIGKNWLHAVAVDREGRVQWRRKFGRSEVGPFFANLAPGLRLIFRTLLIGAMMLSEVCNGKQKTIYSGVQA